MSPLKISIIFLISITFSEVASWTIDLPEARKFFFERADKYEKDKSKENEAKRFEERQFFDNIEPDSPHNTDESEGHEDDYNNDVYNGGKYADDYKYMSYMEKKVHGIVHNGSVYLEGLRRALEDYGEILKRCNRMNFTQQQSSNGPWLPENERPLPGNLATQSQQPSTLPGNVNAPSGSPGNLPATSSNQTGSFGDQIGPFGNQTGLPFNNGTMNQFPLDRETCDRATQSSEHVRRLAELALWATRELQDKAYAEKYDKERHYETEEEEAELLIRLAFFLDRLAYFTGYEPEPQDFITAAPTRPPTTTLPPMSIMGNVPEDIKNQMVTCLQGNSTEIATERCRYPLELPEFLKKAFNISESSNSVQPISYKPKNPSFRETFRNPTQNPMTLPRQKRDVTADKSQEKEDLEAEANTRDKRGFLLNALVGEQLAHKILDEVHEHVERKAHEHEHEEFNIKKIIWEKLQALKHSHKKLVEFLKAKHEQIAKAKEHIAKAKEHFENKRLEKEHFAREHYAREHYARKHFEHEAAYSEKLDRLEELTIGEWIAHEFGSEHHPEHIEDYYRRKRSVETPVLDLMKYYVKHKVWANANQDTSGEFDVSNSLSTLVNEEHETTTAKIYNKVQKRSINDKKYKHMKFPENPSQDLSNYVKHKKGVNYIGDYDEIQKIHQYLERIRNEKSSTAKTNAYKHFTESKSRSKRSSYYGKKEQPSRSENPKQDISYYVKNKEGTEYQNNPQQAAQVRANLEQVFQYPNIEVVRRYGSNQNPAIQFPLAYGIVQSFFVDI